MSEPREDAPPRTAYDEELVMFLERDQLMSDRRRPLPPADVGARAHVALWTLRIFVLIVGAMVIYTFCAQL
jgi:hypothetical protein